MCDTPTVKTGVLTIICFIVAALFSIAIVGCQGVTDPPELPRPNGANGSLVDAQSALGLPVDAGPIITLTNEYMEPVVSPLPAAFMKIPNGVPLTFCWTAKRAPDGGAIEAYRYGWNVINPDDPRQWDVDFTAYDGSRICSPSRSFDVWGFHLFTVEVIDDAGASSRITIAIEIVLGPSNFDVMPGSCKNPLNTQRKGQIRTTIPGRIGLDVGEIDVSSLYLWIDGNTAEPVGTRVRDITAPMINRDPCDCPPAHADGIDDLVILFAATDIIRAMGGVSNGEIRDLSIRGVLHDGDDFALRDCVVIVGNPRTGDDPALFQRDAVLVGLQKGYNEKNFEKVSALFDDDFTFYFSEADVQSGNVPFTQWDRYDELIATANLFNVDYPTDALVVGSIREKPARVGATEDATWGRVKAAFFDGPVGGQTSIVLLLIFPQGEENWVTMPPDPVQYPGEVWYEKTAMYYMGVQAGDVTFITDTVLRTSFVVRFSETKGYWQLVEWRDDI
ncbi:MAG: hypothetical protein JSW58_07145 [Candidatus Latescibacterota bacterium]|nr:MAG: hypothetical protein JSW58_07145 [Candidatus Latescibacterota bacterium]